MRRRACAARRSRRRLGSITSRITISNSPVSSSSRASPPSCTLFTSKCSAPRYSPSIWHSSRSSSTSSTRGSRPWPGSAGGGLGSVMRLLWHSPRRPKAPLRKFTILNRTLRSSRHLFARRRPRMAACFSPYWSNEHEIDSQCAFGNAVVGRGGAGGAPPPCRSRLRPMSRRPRRLRRRERPVRMGGIATADLAFAGQARFERRAEAADQGHHGGGASADAEPA